MRIIFEQTRVRAEPDSTLTEGHDRPEDNTLGARARGPIDELAGIESAISAYFAKQKSSPHQPHANAGAGQTFIVGPQGSGKTTLLMAMRASGDNRRAIEDWDGVTSIEGAAIVLTNTPFEECLIPPGAQVISISTAPVLGQPQPCPCGNEGCNGKSYRPAYAKSGWREPCPLRYSAQSSEKIATTVA
ncbi:MAG: hypothetical protein REI09_05320 [Candidatus Dactylopiibacterium sp.]|nr:hypothetical protein [Candidatus Dactylopiibacterium sp.]